MKQVKNPSNSTMFQNYITKSKVLNPEAVEDELAGHEVPTKPSEITIFLG